MYKYDAIAKIKGNATYNKISGEILFIQQSEGVMIKAKIYNLPYTYKTDMPLCPFGFYIYKDKKLDNQKQNYRGEFSMLMPINNGTLNMQYFTDKFSLKEILGKFVEINLSPFKNAKQKIAYGVIN